MIKYNLQFFAKDGPGGQRTEPATAKKLKDARKKGQVAKSRDLTSSVSLLVFFIILKIYVGTMGTKFINEFKVIYKKMGEVNATSLELNSLSRFFKNYMSDAILDLSLIHI